MERRNFLRGTVSAAGAGLLAAGNAVPAAAMTADDRPRRPFRVQIVMFDGAEELDYTSPFEVFSAAKWFTTREIETTYVRVDGPGKVRAAYGTVVEVPHGWAPEKADVIVVPGGGYRRKDDPGIWSEIARGVLPAALAKARRRGLTIASMCTGSILLGSAGLVRDRPCTTHHGAVTTLEEQGGLIKEARVVDDGDLVTAGGITSGLDLALWLVKRELGADCAVKVESLLEYQARGTVWTA